jgi:very-short-patch-repair endonuclease
MKIFNRKETLKYRRDLRKPLTKEESILWGKLRGKRFMNLKFYRQYGIGPYIADFYCPALNLVIEADGSQHYWPGNREYDRIRKEYMQSIGVTTIRFSNREIRENLSEVLTAIAAWIKKRLQDIPV